MYHFVKAILYLLSLQPFWLLYLWSDLIFFLLYRVFKYRKEMVVQHLRTAFPEKNETEIALITKLYFKNLADYIVETLKLMTINEAKLNQRMTGNWEIINQWREKGRIVQGQLSHQFNWEWGTVLCNWNTPFQFYAIYNPISSPLFERIMYGIRTKSGTKLINMLEYQNFVAEGQKDPNTLWGFIADQNPVNPRRGYWTNFFNQDTVFNKGAEMIARRYDNVVIFGTIQRKSRGRYHVHLETIFEHGGQTKEGEITEAYVKHLEKNIRQEADNWVWSHRRWKHKREVAK
jgi:Kdo2-lipid IVA lauroyltransferase/acyltransferase